MKIDFENEIGALMYEWAKDLFPINRSITGKGLRETLVYIKNILPDLEIKEVSSGTVAFDWEIPDEWNINTAYIEDENGQRVLDFQDNNLHVVGYSCPINEWMSLDELDKYLYSIPEQPDAIPYVTSYYARRWGFCLSHNQRRSLYPGQYHVVIDSNFHKGVLNYGEIKIKGKSKKEIFLSTYICHPSMANNELSGPVVTMGLVLWLLSQKSLTYSYRIIFIPETIGSIFYLSQFGEHLKKNVVAGFVLTCVGDNLTYSFMPSRNGNTLADLVAKNAIRLMNIECKQYSFLERGSDERQYCSPFFNLPIVSLMRSKYGTFKEYHTSLDNLEFISKEGLFGGFSINKLCLDILEKNLIYRGTIPCEPKMDKRNLRPSLGAPKKLSHEIARYMNFLMYADGVLNLIEISALLNVDFFECVEIALKLYELGLIEIVQY
jgi:aminopeptidase-like protein